MATAIRGECVAVGGRPVHFHRRGTGAPVLLLHGAYSLGQEILGSLPPLPGIAWIAPDRPGYGFSMALGRGRRGPIGQAAWARGLLDALAPGQSAGVVAHSYAASVALWLAAAWPDRVARLVLIAPFCRPSATHWEPAMRLAMAPTIGPVLRRRLLPRLVPWLGPRWLAALAGGRTLPPGLRDFPLSLAMRPQTIEAVAAELLAFNADMLEAESIRLQQPVTVIVGAEDRTAPPAEQLAWLRAIAPDLRCVELPGVGHAPHHAAPARVFGQVLEAFDRPRLAAA
jgi:pimeloyl-ACP methyl ester carboxylesterase